MSLGSRRLLVALPVFALFCLVAFNVLYRGKAPVCTDSKVVRATAAGSAAQSESFTYVGSEARPATPCVSEPYRDFMMTSREFLPPASAPSATGPDEDMLRFQEELHRRQHPQQCDGNFPWYWCPYGTSACFHLLSRPMTAAWEKNQPLALSLEPDRTPNPGGFFVLGQTKSDWCKNKSMTCFLEPPTNCSQKNIYIGDLMNSFKPDKWPTHFVPEKWRHRGYFFWVSQQMHYLFRLSQTMKHKIDETKRQLKWKHPIIGMHIRHGDSCKVRLHCWPLEFYMQEANRLRQLYGARTIFVATDSHDIIQKLKRNSSGFDIMHLNFDRRHFDLIAQGKVVSPWGNDHPSLDDCHASGQCDPVVDMERMLIDLALLSQADYFVGAFSANGARLIYELMATNRGCFPPFISLDVPWCHNGGYAMGGFTEWEFTSC